MSVKVLVVVGVIATIALLGISLGLFGTRGTGPKLSVRPVETRTTEVSSVPVVPRNDPAITLSPTTNRPVTVRSNPAPANLITNWEDRLDAILGAEGDDSEKAKHMLAIFSQLPEDGQVEVAQHLSNLLPDDQYAPMGRLLADASLPEAVLDVLIADLLNRPNATKLPLLLEIAKNPQHAKAEEAKDILELYLEDDYGKDWTKWQAKLDEYLKANPEPPVEP